jgi:predicted esterase
MVEDPVEHHETGEPGAIAEGPLADWCTAPYEPVPGGGCLAEASTPASDPLLILYLHGRYARSAPADEVDRQRRLAVKASARGWSVLAMRGTLGACSAAELADWFCWPTGDSQAPMSAAAADAWTLAAREVDDRRGPLPRALLGFSNGGYFAGLLATRGLVDVRSAVIAHAGPVEPVAARSVEPPLLLLSADDDVAQDDMMRLDELLGRAGWPHDSYARSGVHGLTDDDIDAALTFYARTMKSEAVPLDPPLRWHRPTHHVREASALQSPDDQGDDAAASTPYDETDDAHADD